MIRWNFLTDSLESDALYLDCRSEESYEASTVRGAIGTAFIKKPYGSGAASLAKLGGFLTDLKKKTDTKSTIICFDEGEGMYACRMTWVLLGMGVNAKVLGKKFEEIPKEWLGKGAEQLASEPGKAVQVKTVTTISQLQKDLTRVQLIDVRTIDEYSGRLPRMTNPDIGGICGRIPGSVHWDWLSLYDGEGRIRSREEIMNQIREIGLIPERPTVLYDYNGARSCTTALLLSRCGYRQVSVYLGSWMEWRKTDLPKQHVRVWGKD
ncbi:MAG: thiosulfate sulfurtransferase [Leptospirales bacterium]|nr:thiosulfate sulfurtransferase [Leptospirales bacterium]